MFRCERPSSLYSLRHAGLFIIGIIALTCADMLQAAETELSPETFSLHLGATRIFYDPDKKGTLLTVNNNQDYPMLVQSEVLSENLKSPAPFVITPPLFRLDGGQSSSLRIIRTGGEFPSDRETLQWVCVKGIPPTEEDQWAKNSNTGKSINNKVSLKVQFSINSCIKLFVRPRDVRGNSTDAASSVSWQRIGRKLKGTNPTPFYVNLSEVTIGGYKVNMKPPYIAPFSSVEFDMPNNASGDIQWKIINDYGGISKPFKEKTK